MNTVHEESDVIGPEELARVKAQLKWGKQDCYKTPINFLLSLEVNAKTWRK